MVPTFPPLRDRVQHVAAREDHVAAGPITHDEAEQILLRFIASHFHKVDSEHARFSIPAEPRRDDDIRLSAYIAQQRESETVFSQAIDALDAINEEALAARTGSEIGGAAEHLAEAYARDLSLHTWERDVAAAGFLAGVAAERAAAVAWLLAQSDAAERDPATDVAATNVRRELERLCVNMPMHRVAAVTFANAIADGHHVAPKP